MRTDFKFLEFFAGGGMARLGLGQRWDCVFANDVDPVKAGAYRANFAAASELRVADINDLTIEDLPAEADLAWASFPCQDLSLAGNRKGLDAERSGTFWPFWRLLEERDRVGRTVPIVVLENVVGAITSHGGRDFQAILGALDVAGYRFGALVLDAVHFVPQSRPRLFLISVRDSYPVPPEITGLGPSEWATTRALRAAQDAMPPSLKRRWIWWRLPAPAPRRQQLPDLVLDEPPDVPWHSPAETRRLRALMSPIHRRKLRDAQRYGRQVVGTIYRRTRPDGNGGKTQRAEVRFDGIAGCLRTPAGGSSRQTIIVVEGKRVRTRLLSSREAARLMGIPDDYRLPESYNQAYHVAGDGVVIPVVNWITEHIISPMADNAAKSEVFGAETNLAHHPVSAD